MSKLTEILLGYPKDSFVATSSGTDSAGNPVKLNDEGIVDLSMIDITTSDVPEGTNLYYTDERADARTLDIIDDTVSAGATEKVWSADKTSTTISGHVSNTSNPHSVTKDQIGLANVDNTSDINKPISTATQNALDTKINSTEI